MYKFFVKKNQINNNIVEIEGEDVNHIKNVLRIGIDEQIEVCNLDDTYNYLCKIIQLDNKCIRCQIIDKLDSQSEPKTYLHIFQGIPKAEKMEAIIQKTTEIGVNEITPVLMNRCVVKLDDKGIDKKIIRWQKIAEVAAKQSKRDKIPIINYPINIKNIYEKIANYDIVLVAYENEENYTIKDALKEIKNGSSLKIAVIVGPEGGIAENEIECLKTFANTKIVTLGKRILRTETAPITIASVIMYEFDEMI